MLDPLSWIGITMLLYKGPDDLERLLYETNSCIYSEIPGHDATFHSVLSTWSNRHLSLQAHKLTRNRVSWTFFTAVDKGYAPVFPDVGSIIMSPCFKMPSLSASSNIRTPMRSLTDPPALKNSHLPTVRAPSSREMEKKEWGEEGEDIKQKMK